MDRLNPRTYLDTDGAMAANSDERVPTQRAILTYLTTDTGGTGQQRNGRGVDTTDDIIIDDSDSGLVLKSPDGHYWRFQVNNSGALVTTDLGLTKP